MRRPPNLSYTPPFPYNARMPALAPRQQTSPTNCPTALKWRTPIQRLHFLHFGVSSLANRALEPIPSLA